MNTTPEYEPARVLVVGRSPGVLVNAVEVLRSKGYSADATNQFDRVLEDYDVTDIDVLVFGGMVPEDTKLRLRERISQRNSDVTFVQGLAGIPGLIAAQVDATVSSGHADSHNLVYDADTRTLQLTLKEPAHVTTTAWWCTSFTPPEPESTDLELLDDDLDRGPHTIPLPAEIPSEASFVGVAVGSAVHVFSVGPMPRSVMRMVPTGSGAGSAPELPPVRAVTTSSHDQQTDA